MTLRELQKNYSNLKLNTENKNNFPNMEKWIDKKQFENIMTETTPETKKLYFNVCNYNQAIILNNFIKMLFENFNDKMLLNSEYHEKILIDTQNPEEKKPVSCFLGNCGEVYASFIIENYIYYIQIDKNPFFNDSFISCNQLFFIKNDCIYKDYKNKIFYMTSYGKNENINDIFYNIYEKETNSEEEAKKLYNYFIMKHYKQPDATDRTRRIVFINQDKNKYNIKVLEKDF